MLKCQAYVEKKIKVPKFDPDTGVVCEYVDKALGKCILPDVIQDVECEGNCKNCKLKDSLTKFELNQVKEFLHKKQFSIYDIAKALYAYSPECGVPYIIKNMREGVADTCTLCPQKNNCTADCK